MNKHFGAAVLAAFVSTTAWAESGAGHSHWYLDLDPSWYAGGAVGQSTLEDWSLLATLNDGSYRSAAQDDRDVGYRVFAGLGLSRYFALELGYADFGEATFTAESDGSGSNWAAGPMAETFAVSAIDLGLLGKLPLARDVAVFGRVGALRTESEESGMATQQFNGFVAYTATARHNSWSYGAGVEYDGFRPVRLIAGYMAAEFDRSTPNSNNARLDSIALSLAYLF